MKLFVLLIFAGSAVKCDEAGNYYVINRPSDEPVRDLKPFRVYWNVPTFQCKSKKIVFDNLFEKYGIIQNQYDTFQGEKITILYDPGQFPAILKEESSGHLRLRNGGVPQEGNLDEHLTAFRYELDHSIPDPQFSGIGVIDFESWRPIFRQNSWGVLTPYRNLSLLIEKRLHPWWTKGMIEKEAKYRFERAGREFMQATVTLARLLRPQAKWGYYGFPYCFNMAGASPAETCSDIVKKENDQISWLWKESTTLHPSVYSSKTLSSAQLASLIRGRIAESARVGRGTPVLPYFWFKYRDAGFMSEVDLKTALKTMYKSQTSGFIVWGSSNDVNSVAKCEKLQNYLEHVLGPEIAKYTKQTKEQEDSYSINNREKPNATTQNPSYFLTGDSKDDENQAIDSENEGTGESNSETLPGQRDDEIISIINESDKDADEKNILIDIVQKKYYKNATEETMKKIAKNRKKGKPIHDSFTQNSDYSLDFTTKSPVDDLKKKGALFALFYAKNTTVLDNTTSTTMEIVNDDYDFKSTTAETNYTNDQSFTTDHNFKSNTVDILYDDDDDLTTYYNKNTFLDDDFNDTTEQIFEKDRTVSYKETTTATLFNFEMDYDTTTSEPKILNRETGSYNKDKTTVPIYFKNGFNSTMFTESTTKTSTFTNEYTNTFTIDPEGPISDSTLTTSTDRTTTQETDTGDNTLNDESEYQVVITLS